jgi:hypothetical protein
MDDYSALAQRISVSASGVTGALILSRDGLVLGAYPNEDESLAKPAWLRFIALGEPDRSFVEFPDQVWAYVRRGSYAAFATAEPGTRPGVLVDQLENVLLVVEEARARKDALRVPDAASAPSGKPRTSLHPQAGRPSSEPAEVVEIAAAPERASADRDGYSPKAGGSKQPAPSTPVEQSSAAPEETAASRSEVRPETVQPNRDASDDEDSEVDPFLLAKEFSGLLQLDSDGDEGSS